MIANPRGTARETVSLAQFIIRSLYQYITELRLNRNGRATRQNPISITIACLCKGERFICDAADEAEFFTHRAFGRVGYYCGVVVHRHAKLGDRSEEDKRRR